MEFGANLAGHEKYDEEVNQRRAARVDEPSPTSVSSVKSGSKRRRARIASHSRNPPNVTLPRRSANKTALEHAQRYRARIEALSCPLDTPYQPEQSVVASEAPVDARVVNAIAKISKNASLSVPDEIAMRELSSAYATLVHLGSIAEIVVEAVPLNDHSAAVLIDIVKACVSPAAPQANQQPDTRPRREKHHLSASHGQRSTESKLPHEHGPCPDEVDPPAAESSRWTVSKPDFSALAPTDQKGDWDVEEVHRMRFKPSPSRARMHRQVQLFLTTFVDVEEKVLTSRQTERTIRKVIAWNFGARRLERLRVEAFRKVLDNRSEGMEPAHAGSGIWLLESEGEFICIADVLPTRCNSQRPRSNPRRKFREPLLFNTDAESRSGYRTVITIPAYVYPGFEALGVDEPNGIVREIFSPFVDRIVIPNGDRDLYRSNVLYEVDATSYRCTRDNPNGGWVALTPTIHKTREKFSPLPLSDNIAQNYAQSRLFKWVPVKGVVLKSVLDYHVIVAAQGHGQQAYLARDSGITDGDLVSFSSVTVKFDGAVRHVAANCRMIKPDYLKRLPTGYGTLFNADGDLEITDGGWFLQEPYIGRIPLPSGRQLAKVQPRACVSTPFRAVFDAESVTMELQAQTVCEGQSAQDIVSRRGDMLALIAAKSGEAADEDRVMLNYDYHKARRQSTTKSNRRDPTSVHTLLSPLYAMSAANAVLRVLIHTPFVRDVFTAGVFARYVNLHSDTGTQGKLSAHISALLDLARSEQFDEISAEGFYRFASKHLKWTGRDASEFVVSLLDKLHADTLQNAQQGDGATTEARCSDSVAEGTSLLSPVKDIFSTRLIDIEKCQRCDYETASLRDVLVLLVPFASYNLSECLQKHFLFPLKGAVCTRAACGGKVQRRVRVRSLPPVLAINFDRDPDGSSRLSEVPDTLDLRRATDGTVESASYRLYAAVVNEDCKLMNETNTTEEEALMDHVRNQKVELDDDRLTTTAYIRHPGDSDVWMNFFELTPVVDGKPRPQAYLRILDKEASQKPLRRGYLYFYTRL